MEPSDEKRGLPPDVMMPSSVDNSRQPMSWNADAHVAPALNPQSASNLPGYPSTTTPGAAVHGYQQYPVQMPSPIQQQGVTVIVARPPAQKSLTDAYLLWFPLGLLGLHHFYLRRYAFGFLYLFTGGVFGVGWLVDGVRMPWLVRDANKRIQKAGLAPGGGLGIGADVDDDDEPMSLTDAYIMWFPLGLIGLHHYYLRRPSWGVAYTFTFGLFSIGWLVDAFRMPTLVKEANERRALERAQRMVPVQKSLWDAYALGVTPAGIFGAHHFYLGRVMFGVYYMLTLGGFGIGWIVDWFRMPVLVHRANNTCKYPLGVRHKFVDDAYVMAFPGGLFGLHHFYLERPGWGTLYLFTGGLCGIGWLIDLCRMPCLVAQTNCRLEQEASLMQAVRQVPFMCNGPVGTTTCIVTSGDMSSVVAGQGGNYQFSGQLIGGPNAIVSGNSVAPAVTGGVAAVAPPPPYTEALPTQRPEFNANQPPPAYNRYGSMEDSLKPPLP